MCAGDVPPKAPPSDIGVDAPGPDIDLARSLDGQPDEGPEDASTDVPPKLPRADGMPSGDASRAQCPASNFSNVVDCARVDGVCAYEFNVSPDRLDCAGFCVQVREMRCERAWVASGEFYCRPLEEVACDVLADELVCGCAP